MPKYYDGWAILTRLQKDVDIVTQEVSEAIVREWKDLVDVLFYQSYTPYRYNRTRESINSIGILNISSSNGKYEVEMGYDDSKIHTYEQEYFTSHENPDEMGARIEWGFDGGIYGHDKDGIQSIDELNKLIKNGYFNNVVEKKLRKLGYEVAFK